MFLLARTRLLFSNLPFTPRQTQRRLKEIKQRKCHCTLSTELYINSFKNGVSTCDDEKTTACGRVKQCVTHALLAVGNYSYYSRPSKWVLLWPRKNKSGVLLHTAFILRVGPSGGVSYGGAMLPRFITKSGFRVRRCCIGVLDEFTVVMHRYIPRLSLSKTSIVIAWFLVTCPWSNSNVSRSGYNWAAVVRALHIISAWLN